MRLRWAAGGWPGRGDRMPGGKGRASPALGLGLETVRRSLSQQHLPRIVPDSQLVLSKYLLGEHTGMRCFC